MKLQNVKLTKWNGYKIQGYTAYSKAKKLYLNRYPSEKTIKTLKKLGVNQIVYQNGDFISL